MKSLPKSSRREFVAGLLAGGVALSLGSTWAAACPAHPQVARAEGFDSQVQSALLAALDRSFAGTKAPGVIAGVWQGDKEWTVSRGKTALQGGATPSLDLHTRVGSVTKTMVGTLILELVDEGKVGLDDTVEAFFPALPLADQITVRMLGKMASGIASYTLSDQFTERYFKNPTESWTTDQLLAMAFHLPREFAPGQGFQYCNTNFVMLGVMIEKLRGRPLGEVLRERLFDPLDMPQSSYPLGLGLPEPSWNGYTLQGTPDGTTTPTDATHWSPTFGAGAGEVVSCLHDLRAWARALGRGHLLEPATQAVRLEPNTYSQKGKRAYCFGVGVENGWISHAGTLPGYNTQVAYLPSQDIAIVVMTNSDTPGEGGLPAVAVYNELAVVLAPGNNPVGA